MKKSALDHDVAASVIRVELGTIADAIPLGDFLTRAWKEAGPGALGFTGATEQDIKEIASEEFLAKRLSGSKSRVVVAERRGEVLGFASIRKTSPRRAELSGVVVLESMAGKGLGTKMLRRAFDVAIGLGVERLTVKTEMFNERAIDFYEKNGFVKKRTTTAKVGTTEVPTQVLEKKLE